MTKLILFTLAMLCTLQVACGGGAKQTNTTTTGATTATPENAGGSAESQPSK
ncbi:MAG: hypothetical protein ABI321_04240 [Polyangia bacterium]